MKPIATLEGGVFIIVLLFIAVLINGAQFAAPSQQAISNPAANSGSTANQQRQVELERKAAQDAVAERARYLARYLNPGFTRKPGTKTLAIAVVSEDGKFNHDVGVAISGRFKPAGVEVLSHFFTPEFVSDGLFTKTFVGSNEAVKNLELAKTLNALLLARQWVEYSTNASLQNVISAHMRLEVMYSPVAIQNSPKSWTLKADGAGFTEKDARSMAESRILDEIAKDPKMSLSELPQ